MRDVADVRIHGTTHERPIERFEVERAALKPVGNHPSHLRVRHLTRKVTSDGRIDVDTNRYSVPPKFLGTTLDVRVESGLVQVMFRGQIIAEHPVHPGRHQVIEDPGHTEALCQASTTKSSEIRRSLAHYAAIVGGEPW